MSNLSIDQILSAIPSLTPSERGAIQMACNALPKEDRKPHYISDFWVELCKVGTERGYHLSPIATLPEPLWKDLMFQTEVVSGLINKLCPSEATRTQLVAAQRTISCSLFDYMNAYNIPITTRTVVQQVSNARTAIDHSFPGYEASGLLRLVAGSWDQAAL